MEAEHAIRTNRTVPYNPAAAKGRTKCQAYCSYEHFHHSIPTNRQAREWSEEAVTVLDHSINPEGHEGESTVSSINYRHRPVMRARPPTASLMLTVLSTLPLPSIRRLSARAIFL